MAICDHMDGPHVCSCNSYDTIPLFSGSHILYLPVPKLNFGKLTSICFEPGFISNCRAWSKIHDSEVSRVRAAYAEVS